MTKDLVKVFQNEHFGNIRVVLISGREHFCAKDIATCLGYSNQRDAVNRHCKGVVKHDMVSETTNQHGVTSHQVVSMSFIPEGDVYRLITHSKLPAAEEFERWVFDEVLPQIRKTGGYIPITESDSEEEIMAKALLIAQNTINKKNEIIEMQKKQMEIDKPKVIFADAVSASDTSILIGDLAKLLKQNGVDTGAKRLFAWLRHNGYLIKRNGSDYNSPTQKAMELGLFEVKETSITHGDGHISVNKTTKVTSKGQIYFINKFLNGGACNE